MAQAQFQLASYAGYVQAAQTALLAQQLAARSRISRGGKPASAAKTLRQPPVRSLRRAASGVTRRLWQRLPLLAILLGWLFAGILAGVASLPFHEGAIADLRQTLLPVWALGLLVMVLIGFIRSIRRIAIRRL
jgi:hypothetical protein